MPNEITFSPAEPRYLADVDCLAFTATADGRPVECIATAEFLATRFGAEDSTEEAMRRAYGQREEEIHAVARGLIEAGLLDRDGAALLTTRLTDLTVAYSEQLAAWPDGLDAARKAQRTLAGVIGPQAECVNVEWGVGGESPDSRAVSVRLTDPTLPYTKERVLEPRVLSSGDSLALRLGLVWGNVLNARVRKLALKRG